MLFLAGKGTILKGADLVRNIDMRSIDWKENDNSVAKLALWIAEKIFWRLLRTFFHITDTANYRNEIFFYHKSDFQRLVDVAFAKMKTDKKIKSISEGTVKKMKKSFDFTPEVARCRLLNKSNINSFRMITRKPKVDSTKSKFQIELRLLLAYIAKKLYSGSVDVRGMYHVQC